MISGIFPRLTRKRKQFVLQRHPLKGNYVAVTIDGGCMDLPRPIFLKNTGRPEKPFFPFFLLGGRFLRKIR